MQGRAGVSLHSEGRWWIVGKPSLIGKVRLARYKLMPCTAHKNKREYKLGEYKGKHFIPMRPIEVTISKYGDESYKLVSSQPLVAGEYGLLTEEKVYTFGVDGSK